jgi:hypothetical protein
MRFQFPKRYNPPPPSRLTQFFYLIFLFCLGVIDAFAAKYKQAFLSAQAKVLLWLHLGIFAI